MVGVARPVRFSDRPWFDRCPPFPASGEKKEWMPVFVSATTRCFSGSSFRETLTRLSDLEFTAVEIVLDEENGPLRPSEAVSDLDRVILECRDTMRMSVAAYGLDTPARGEEFFRQFAAVCKLAKATQVVTLVAHASELGTPFNEEIDRLKRMVGIATSEGVVVALLTETGTMTESPDTAAVLCKTVKGLQLCLDPSHFIYQRESQASMEPVLPYVRHVRLRDTTAEKLQVQVGQGNVEYGKLVAHLGRFEYDKALSVDVLPQDDIDQNAELRKFRLLLESLL
ncbi:MAG: sugar phosphate isomerase/epimerase [Planctomycetota bacterium]|nr:MAG: sugar phosphate isomerase/epimerase [Planctomycetota bacterium]